MATKRRKNRKNEVTKEAYKGAPNTAKGDVRFCVVCDFLRPFFCFPVCGGAAVGYHRDAFVMRRRANPAAFTLRLFQVGNNRMEGATHARGPKFQLPIKAHAGVHSREWGGE